jgi:predicted transcriptional regulator
METQNITIAVKKDVLHKAKEIAVRRQTSLSRLITAYFQELVNQEDEYQQAMQRHLAVVEKGYDLGTHGKISWKRDELYDR